MPQHLYLDTETFSDVPIKNGLHAYVEGNERPVEVMLFAYAVDDAPVVVVDLTNGEEIPTDILTMCTDPSVVKVMHNSQFDRTVLRTDPNIELTIPVNQIDDTMILALAHGLPAGLGDLCEVLRIPADKAKDKRGRQLIQLFCKPRPKKVKIRRATRETHPQDWEDFITYAGSDIEAMRIAHNSIPRWNMPRIDMTVSKTDFTPGCERSLWELDQRINDRGFRIDIALANAAVDTMERAKETLAKRVKKLTNGEVQRATQRDVFLKYIEEEHNTDLPDLRKTTLEKRLDDPYISPELRELFAIRLEASTTSVSKYTKLLQTVSRDGCLRATLQFDGANRTRRWAGRLFQPQNLPRPSHKQSVIDSFIEDLKDDCADLIHQDVIALTSSSVRGCIVPREGRKLCVADLSNIEGRFAAWVCGEEWKIKAFEDYDNGIGPDLYVKAYANMFNVDPTQVGSAERQIGKVTELMLGYGGGVGAFLTGAITYNIDLNELADVAWPKIPERIKREAQIFLDWTKQQKRSTFGLTDEVFKTCEALKRMWREAHPAISNFWKDIEATVRQSLLTPGVEFRCGDHIRVITKGSWLRVILPSGHSLCYPSPRVEGDNISYFGVNQYTRKWQRIKTYGGKFLENICQSGARDVMAWNMPSVEQQGYEIILTVHDELITEVPNTPVWNCETLSKILSTNPVWASRLPLAAQGFEALRYRKD